MSCLEIRTRLNNREGAAIFAFKKPRYVHDQGPTEPARKRTRAEDHEDDEDAGKHTIQETRKQSRSLHLQVRDLSLHRTRLSTARQKQ